MPQRSFLCRWRAFGVVSADGTLVVLDTRGQKAWSAKAPEGINTVLPLDPCVFAAGDDEGGTLLYDLRQQNPIAVMREQEDFVSDMAVHAEQLLCSGGDGTLCVYDLRKRKLHALSDPQDDERLCVEVARDGSKVICGTQGGTLEIFSWDNFGDLNDRIVGHPMSIDTCVKFDENTLLTGSSDGVVRVVGLFPNRIMGTLGEHLDQGSSEAFPIERVALSFEKSIVASVSHDYRVKFWSTDAVATMQRSGTAPSVPVTGSSNFFDDL